MFIVAERKRTALRGSRPVQVGVEEDWLVPVERVNQGRAHHLAFVGAHRPPTNLCPLGRDFRPMPPL